MNLLDRIREATIDNILFMFFAYSTLFILSVISLMAWLMYKGVL
jgi:hypothetical protein